MKAGAGDSVFVPEMLSYSLTSSVRNARKVWKQDFKLKQTDALAPFHLNSGSRS